MCLLGLPSDGAKGAALEALAARQPLSPAHMRALAAAGVAAVDRASSRPERPWGAVDDAMARRLHRVRRWSPAAIPAFLNGPEARVQSALGPR